ncbi:MAG: hypothetical protein R3258_03435 [Acidimicrobiia bacterium]|nr:hypothetical protein [Acidimicrobiia bacterium]
MVKIKIDLQDDPLIPAGRDLLGQLVGAHLSASDEEELLHMVGLALNDVHSSNIGEGLRILTHATYHAQEIIVQLLEIGAERGLALEELAGGILPPLLHEDVAEEKRRLWSDIRSYRP